MEDFVWVLPLIGTLVGALITGTVTWIIAARAHKAEDRKQLREWATEVLIVCEEVISGALHRRGHDSDAGDDLPMRPETLWYPVRRVVRQGDLFAPPDILENASNLSNALFELIMAAEKKKNVGKHLKDVFKRRNDFVNSIRKLHHLKSRNRVRPEFRSKSGLAGTLAENQSKEIEWNEKSAPSQERPSSEKPVD